MTDYLYIGIQKLTSNWNRNLNALPVPYNNLRWISSGTPFVLCWLHILFPCLKLICHRKTWFLFAKVTGCSISLNFPAIDENVCQCTCFLASILKRCLSESQARLCWRCQFFTLSRLGVYLNRNGNLTFLITMDENRCLEFLYFYNAENKISSSALAHSLFFPTN